MKTYVLSNADGAVKVCVADQGNRVAVTTAVAGKRTQPGALTIPTVKCRGGTTAMEARLIVEEFAKGIRGAYGQLRLTGEADTEVNQAAAGECTGTTVAAAPAPALGKGFLSIPAGMGEKIVVWLDKLELPVGVSRQESKGHTQVVFTEGVSIKLPRPGLAGGGEVPLFGQAHGFALALVAKGFGDLMLEEADGTQLQVTKAAARTTALMSSGVTKEAAEAFGLKSMFDLAAAPASAATAAIVF
ncbi:MAG: hypothetical protein ACREPQ_14615 [Rhodanobacter sp.]